MAKIDQVIVDRVWTQITDSAGVSWMTLQSDGRAYRVCLTNATPDDTYEGLEVDGTFNQMQIPAGYSLWVRSDDDSPVTITKLPSV